MPSDTHSMVPWECWGGPYCGRVVMLTPGANMVRLPGTVGTLTHERYVAHPTKPQRLRWAGSHHPEGARRRD